MAEAKGLNSIERSEHISAEDSGDNISAKRVAGYQWDGANWQRASTTQAVTLSSVTPTFVAALTNSVTQVSTTPKKLSNWSIDNNNNVYAYVQLFNVSSGGSVTLGVTTPNAVISIPPLSSTNVARMGWNFTTGIFAAATTTATGSTALPTSTLNPTFGIE